MVNFTGINWLFREVTHPVNIFIIILNILFFIGILVLFFWFILSNQFEAIMLEKIDILSLFMKNNPEVKESIKEIINEIDINELKDKSENDKKARNIVNLKALDEHIIWWFGVFGALAIIALFWMVYKNFKCKSKTDFCNEKITGGDVILIFLISISFVAEIIFYLVLVNEWKFIGDYEIVDGLV